MPESWVESTGEDLKQTISAAMSQDSSSHTTNDILGEVESKGFGSPAGASPAPSKTLDFGVKSASVEPTTPTTPFVPSAKDEALDYNQFVMDTLLWTNRVRSAFYLLVGSALIVLVDYMMSAGVPLLTVICQLTLLQMSLNFVRSAVSPSLQERATWLDSAWTAVAISRIAAIVKTIAAVHDRHLSASSPHKHLIIAGSLWVLSMFTSIVQTSTLVLSVYIGAFFVPLLYTTYRKAIDPVVKQAFDQAKVKFDAMHRHPKAAGIALVILLLGYRMSKVDLAIAAFVVCVYARSQLPTEVEKLGKRVAPVTTPLGKTAIQFGGHIGRAMEGAMEKFELTPTPAKKKKQ